jgi:hypothetical protein
MVADNVPLLAQPQYQFLDQLKIKRFACYTDRDTASSPPDSSYMQLTPGLPDPESVRDRESTQ